MVAVAIMTFIILQNELLGNFEIWDLGCNSVKLTVCPCTQATRQRLESGFLSQRAELWSFLLLIH